MALRLWLAVAGEALLLGAPGLALPTGSEGPPPAALGSSSHSVHYFHTAVSEPPLGSPQYIAVGYLDGHLFLQYDSITRRAQPRAPWMEKVVEEDPEYWERNTQIEQGSEQWFRENLAVLKHRYNHSGGFHSLQWMYSCELRADRSKRGHMQYGYDGRDYIALDKETLTWTAAVPKAQITKHKWEKELAIAQRQKEYLEEICIEWLQKYLEYGKERLLRREPPVGKVTRMFLSEGREMLVCQAHGFYPKEIEATWRKGGEIMEQDTFWRSVAPNSDGTYHAWLSIEINPEDRELYRCHIDHTGLTEPLVLAWEAPGGSSSHSLHYFYTGVSEPNQGLPQFITVGYVDNQLFSQYDSVTKREQPRAPWIKKVDEDDPQYWDRNTQISWNAEQVFRENLQILRNRYNQSGGFHSVQWMYGCELRADGSPGGGHSQFAYDGRDYLSFDKETLTWTAADPKAQITKMKWEKDLALAQRQKAYLEEICIEWLRRYLDYGKETLLRREPPVGKVTSMSVSEGRVILVCHMYGFYPKEIEATWRKNGEIVEEGTFRRSIAPNSDGTYHAWLGVETDPADRGLYRCHIDHAGLPEPLVLAWEVPGGSSSHSLRYFYTGVSEPNQGLPQFITVGYVDGHLFSQYDSVARREQPRAPWIKKVDEDDPQYWDRNTQISWNAEQVFRENLQILRNRYNQSRGFHSMQWMYGCELREDGSPGGGHSQFAYDGRDYLSFDKETLTWTAAVPTAQITKRKWEMDLASNLYVKAYLEENCIEWLRRYLDYGKETLLRAEPPVGKVTSMSVSEGRVILLCQIYGFYPNEIEATWRKGGEIVEQDTFRRSIAPNSDGTYHAWLGIKMDPADRGRYQCHINHAGLTEPLVLAWEVPGGNQTQ
ncbi:uncharacterized protein LOC110070514 isoform X2 [Pogona vitticeps]